MTGDRELLLWPDGDLSAVPERWIRTGECIRCGACCEDEDRPHYLVGLLDDADGGVVDADGGDRTADAGGHPSAAADELPPGAVVAEDWDGGWVFWRQSGVRHGPCPKWQGDATCSVYGAEDFPHVCRKWPVLPYEMENYPTCGFHFVRLSGGGLSDSSEDRSRRVGSDI